MLVDLKNANNSFCINYWRAVIIYFSEKTTKFLVAQIYYPEYQNNH